MLCHFVFSSLLVCVSLPAVVSVKKENARLRYSFDQLMSGNVGPIGLSPNDSPQGLLPPGTGTISSITGLPMSSSKPSLRIGTPDGFGTTNGGGHRSISSTPFNGRSQPPSRPQSAFVQPSSMAASGTRGQSRPGTAAPQPIGNEEWQQKEQRYKSMIGKLQRQVEEHVRSYRTLRTQYTNELAGRTELQTFVKKCIDDVRTDMAERGRSASLRRAQGQHRATSAGALRQKQPLPPPLDPRSIPLAEFTPQDRISVMEWLMSQDQVIFMLYEKIFPQRAGSGSTMTGGGTNGLGGGVGLNNNASEFDLSKLTQPLPGQPGSLFNPPPPSSSSTLPSSSSSHRPSSSPVNHQSFGAGSSFQARPQTSAGLQTRNKINTTATSGSTATGSTLQPTNFNTNGKPSQYERPLGARPLSGFTPSSADQPSSSSSSSHPRPHTAAAAAAGSSFPSSIGVGRSSELTNAANLHAEVEAELRAARAERERDYDENEEEDQDGSSYQHHRPDGLADLSEDEDEDRHLYEQKEDGNEEDDYN